MSRILFSLIAVFYFTLPGTAADTLRLNRAGYEALFLQNNLQLVASKMQVSMAEAQVVQAGLWPAPQLTLDQVNLWATKTQTGGKELVPPLWGNFARNRQFAIELEQLLETAGKRRKRVAAERVNVSLAQQDFEAVLLQLKTEFRQQLTTLQYSTLLTAELQKQVTAVQQLAQAFEKGAEAGHLPRNEYLRLQAKENELRGTLAGWKQQDNRVQARLKSWLHLPPETVLQIDSAGFNHPAALPPLTLAGLLQQARTRHPDVQRALLRQDYFTKRHAYEKSLRVPDLTLKAAYDRNGGIMPNFIGFGIAMDLPLFNRNAGNIRLSQLQTRQAQVDKEALYNQLENEVAAAWQSLVQAADFRNTLLPQYLQQLDATLEAYGRNLRQRNVSLLEYIDFLEAALAGKQTALDAAKAVHDAADELNYTIGTDVIP